MIKIALAIKNNFTINDSECFYLLRQCKAFKFDVHPQYGNYYDTLDKYYKKTGYKVCKIEEQIVQLLENKNYVQVC